MNKVVEQLKGLQHAEVNPREEWVAMNRARLLSQIKNTIPAKHTAPFWVRVVRLVPNNLAYKAVRPVAMAVVVVLVATTALSGTVKASEQTLPGDWLYPAKRAAEKTQSAVLSFFGNKDSETKFHVALANRRADETRQIMRTGDPSKVARVSEVVADLKDEIKAINTNLNTKNGLGANTAKDVKQNTDQIKNVLQDVKTNLILTSVKSNKALSQEVSDTKDLVKDVGVKAVEVMVEKHLQGDTTISKEEVAEALNTSVKNNLNDVAVSKLSVDGTKTIVETVKVQVIQDLSKAVVPADNGANTVEFATKLQSAAAEVKEAAVKTKEISETVGRQFTEAKVLINNNDLDSAVDKLKELTQATKEADHLSSTAIETAQGVLPIVQVTTSGTPATTASGTVSVVPVFASSAASVSPTLQILVVTSGTPGSASSVPSKK